MPRVAVERHQPLATQEVHLLLDALPCRAHFLRDGGHQALRIERQVVRRGLSALTLAVGLLVGTIGFILAPQAIAAMGGTGEVAEVWNMPASTTAPLLSV